MWRPVGSICREISDFSQMASDGFPWRKNHLKLVSEASGSFLDQSWSISRNSKILQNFVIFVIFFTVFSKSSRDIVRIWRRDQDFRIKQLIFQKGISPNPWFRPVLGENLTSDFFKECFAPWTCLSVNVESHRLTSQTVVGCEALFKNIYWTEIGIERILKVTYAHAHASAGYQ